MIVLKLRIDWLSLIYWETTWMVQKMWRVRNEDRNRERERGRKRQIEWTGKEEIERERRIDRKRQIERGKERETEGYKRTIRNDFNILSNGNFLQFPHTFISKRIIGKNKKNITLRKKKIIIITFIFVSKSRSYLMKINASVARHVHHRTRATLIIRWKIFPSRRRKSKKKSPCQQLYFFYYMK